jgi:small subunit ribosomal protein S20
MLVAYHVSAEKRSRQALKRTVRNRHVKATTRGFAKEVREALGAGNASEAQKALPLFIKEIDKAVSKGIYHRKTASRYISRLSAQVAALKAHA